MSHCIIECLKTDGLSLTLSTPGILCVHFSHSFSFSFPEQKRPILSASLGWDFPLCLIIFSLLWGSRVQQEIHLTQSAAQGKGRTGAEGSHKSTRLCFVGSWVRGHKLISVLQKVGKRSKVRWWTISQRGYMRYPNIYCLEICLVWKHCETSPSFSNAELLQQCWPWTEWKIWISSQ